MKKLTYNLENSKQSVARIENKTITIKPRHPKPTIPS